MVSKPNYLEGLSVEELTDEEKELIRMAAWVACDNNHRIVRNRMTNEPLIQNPYPSNTAAHLLWNQAYRYRDMVNDG